SNASTSAPISPARDFASRSDSWSTICTISTRSRPITNASSAIVSARRAQCSRCSDFPRLPGSRFRMNATSDYNLYTLLASGFPDDLDGCCIETEDGTRYSWNDVERESAMLAGLLVRLGLSAGDRVAVQVEKSPEALLLYLATLRAGCVFLPLNTGYQAAEIDYFLGDAEPAMVVCTPANLGWIEPIAHRHRVRHVFTLGADRSGTLLEAAAAESQVFETRATRGADLACIV